MSDFEDTWHEAMNQVLKVYRSLPRSNTKDKVAEAYKLLQQAREEYLEGPSTRKYKHLD